MPPFVRKKGAKLDRTFANVILGKTQFEHDIRAKAKKIKAGRKKRALEQIPVATGAELATAGVPRREPGGVRIDVEQPEERPAYKVWEEKPEEERRTALPKRGSPEGPVEGEYRDIPEHPEVERKPTIKELFGTQQQQIQPTMTTLPAIRKPTRVRMIRPKAVDNTIGNVRRVKGSGYTRRRNTGQIL
jgi:hypothetical protein